jgi:protein TonB
MEILDNHAASRLSAAQKAAVDAHLASCDSCCDHWYAQQILAARHVPPVPAELLAETRRLVEAQNPGRPRRPFISRLALGGCILTAGAVLAAVGIVTQSERATNGVSAPAQSSPRGAPPIQTSPTTPEATERTDGVVDTERQGALASGEFFPLLRVAPQYPLEAAEEQREGIVIVQFTITEAGEVADVEVVESTDTIFEQAAVNAVEQFMYMPRVVDGEPVAVAGVRNRIRFVLGDSEQAESPAMRYQALTGAPDPSMRPSFWEIVSPALACVGTGDLLCAELVLDEASATYDFNPGETRAVWRLYGFIFAKLEDYERAIAAYETATAIPGAWKGDTTRLTIAYLYFKRQQYAPALKKALEYIETAETPLPSANQFVERLRQLGVTPDAL